MTTGQTADQQNATLVAVQQTLGDALLDQRSAGELLANPAAFFRRNNLDLSKGKDAEFNKYFQAIDEELQTQLSNTLSGERLDVSSDAAARGRLGCWACKAAVWDIAISLVTLGAAGVVLLTPESVIVGALARILAMDAFNVARFVVGLALIVHKGVDAVANATCHWVHSC